MISIIVVEHLELYVDIGERLSVDLGLPIVMAHIAIARTGTPVHCSTLEALVAATCDGALIEPSAGRAIDLADEVERIGIIVLSIEVSHATAVAGLVEVPTGNDVGL